MERFKDIELYGRTLKVSNYGRIFENGIEKNYHYDFDGYKRISMNNRCPRVHRLVAMAFVYNDDPKRKVEVNHKDFDRTNANADNLEWVTHKENVRYSTVHNRYKLKDKHGENNSNYGNTKLSKFYKENPDIALEKQSRKGIKNGRCVKISLYEDGRFIKYFNYIELCISYLIEVKGINAKRDSVRSQINKSVRKNKPYKGFTFIKHK